MLQGTLPQGQHRTYSVCAPQDTASADLVALFEQVCQQTITVNRGAFTQPPRNMPKPWRGPVLPGWSPKVSLEQGVRRLMAQRQKDR
jgi:hypothetical protein